MSAAALSAEAIAPRLNEILDDCMVLEGPLLPILHAVQAEYGHVPQTALPQIADRLNVTRAEVHGVMSFYHDFRQEPAGAHVVKLCRAEACQAIGANRVAAHAKKALGVEWGGTTKDGTVTLEPVYCLGLCACGPAALVDGQVVGWVDEKKFDAIVGDLK